MTGSFGVPVLLMMVSPGVFLVARRGVVAGLLGQMMTALPKPGALPVTEHITPSSTWVVLWWSWPMSACPPYVMETTTLPAFARPFSTYSMA
ncbi:hypothetical protein DXZ75_11325 [Streptomyces sp. AcE210]|nr:hypothetical protein DXZ75_11325 [Streptomyces sp. AcE210]